MSIIVEENLVSFKELEQKIFDSEIPPEDRRVEFKISILGT